MQSLLEEKTILSLFSKASLEATKRPVTPRLETATTLSPS